MNDRELLDLLAQDAPAPRPDLPDEVMDLARRVRTRWRTTVLVTTVGVAIAGSLVIAAALWSTGARQRVEIESRPTAVAPDPAAAPYASAIRAVVTQETRGNPSGPWPPVLFVLSHTCSGVDKAPPSLDCAGPPLGDRLQADLMEALRPYGPVVFVTAMKDALDKDMTTKGGGIQVTLGPIRFNGANAEVPIATHRNIQGGEGIAVWLTLRSGRWTADAKPPPGTIGGGWIS